MSAPEPVTPPRLRIPPWLRRQLPQSPAFGQTRELLTRLNLHTVCESAQCPNHWECWESKTATFMIGGDRCTRSCSFCAVTTAKPLPLDLDEPRRVAEAARTLGLKHVVITSVSRDDLADGGADHFRRTIEAVRQMSPSTYIEVLTPDFNNNDAAIATLLSAAPDVFNHNIETVRRLTPEVRSRATYEGSLSVLRKVAQRRQGKVHVKSGLMLGLGETEEELWETLRDLREAGCELLTLGQYLQPSLKHLTVRAYITPEQFAAYGERARSMGFLYVASSPMVRSSYHAADFKPVNLNTPT